MARAGEHHGAFLIVKGAHALAALRHDRRGGDALQRHAAFFADGPQTMEVHFVADRIDLVFRTVHVLLASSWRLKNSLSNSSASLWSAFSLARPTTTYRQSLSVVPAWLSDLCRRENRAQLECPRASGRAAGETAAGRCCSC